MLRLSSHRVMAVCLAAAAVLCAAAARAEAPQVAADPMATAVESRIAAGRAAGEALRAGAEVGRFYRGRGFAAAWQGSTGSSDATAMLASIDGSRRHGLCPDDLHRAKIAELIAAGAAGAADLDVLLTDAFLMLGSALASGLANPFASDISWSRTAAGVDLAAVLGDALAQHRVEKALEGLAPQGEDYRRLQQVLASYEEAASRGPWPTVTAAGEKIEPGMSDPRVAEVRRRLAAEGRDLPPAEKTKALAVSQLETSEELYDDALKDAVIRFQDRHGLTTDGIIGRGTIAAMNAPASWRAFQARLGLDRQRALRARLEAPRVIVVNIPDFRVRVLEAGREVLAMKAIVGRRDRKTPRMVGDVRFIVFSPQWDVPFSIAVKDKLPEIKKNPAFLASHGMRITSNGEAVDPETVDWEAVDAGNWDYHITQRPGDDNALGRVKFMFPNRDNVYLHDTPTKGLFQNAVRTFSSGCIRIEKPVELAELLLRDKEGWDRTHIEAAMGRKDSRYVSLTTPVPITIAYVTAWARADGTPEFRDDVYGIDRALEKRFCR